MYSWDITEVITTRIPPLYHINFPIMREQMSKLLKCPFVMKINKVLSINHHVFLSSFICISGNTWWILACSIPIFSLEFRLQDESIHFIGWRGEIPQFGAETRRLTTPVQMKYVMRDWLKAITWSISLQRNDVTRWRHVFVIPPRPSVAL